MNPMKKLNNSAHNSFLSPFLFGSFLSLTIGFSCADSVLYPNHESSAPKSGIPDTGVTEPQSTPKINQPAPETKKEISVIPLNGMIFVFDPEDSIENDTVMNALFPDHGIEGIKIQEALDKAEYVFSMKMRVQTTEIIENVEQNEFKRILSGTISVQLPDTNSESPLLSRDFLPNEEGIILENIASQDFMISTLQANQNQTQILLIEAARPASSTKELAEKNPWKGVVKLRTQDGDKVIGRLEGYLLPINNN